MVKITGRIREATEGKGLWLFIDREGDIKNSPDDIFSALGVTEREEDTAGRVAYAILPEEVRAIKEACDEWLAENEG